MTTPRLDAHAPLEGGPLGRCSCAEGSRQGARKTGRGRLASKGGPAGPVNAIKPLLILI